MALRLLMPRADMKSTATYRSSGALLYWTTNTILKLALLKAEEAGPNPSRLVPCALHLHISEALSGFRLRQL